MSFGMFNAAPGSGGGLNVVLFSLAAVVIVVGLIYWLSRVGSPLLAVAIGLIVGGAVGNVVDRIRYGAVVDFLDFHIGNYHWPAFNLADSAICLGVVVMLFDSLLLRREAH
jgi:signal peptidase II